MEDFSNIINWDNLYKSSKTFKKNKPFKHAFVEEIFHRGFYEKLYKTYPKINEKFTLVNSITKMQYWRGWDKRKDVENKISNNKEDPSLSKEWNKFLRYITTDEFASHFREFSGINVTNISDFGFTAYKKGGFQLPHIHNVGPNTLVMLFYFSKGWQKGDPGGTYCAYEEDESKIFFEPYNLDNSMIIFHDGPLAAHGARYITKDVTRQAFAVNIENYSNEKGWSGGIDKQNFISSVKSKNKKTK